MIRAVHGKQQYDKECFYRFGEELILAKHPVLLEYLDQEYVKYSKSKKVLQTIQKNTSEDEKKKWKIYLEISWRHFVIMNCRELITFLETEVPLETAEGWDNPGFLVGDKDKEIKKVLVVLDITNEVVDYAIDQKADFILAHHPIIFQRSTNARVMISFRRNY